ncbi:MAG: phosphodiester glycosidase family protein, partial [Microcystaceae cyanobacterium]
STIQGDQVVAQQTGGPAGQLAFPIPADGYVLVVRGNTVNPNLFTPGTRLTVQSQTSPSNFASFPHTLGAGPLLIDQGRIVLDAALEKFNPAFQKQTASRSAIAVDRSGKLALIALHNRVGGTGPTLGETAVILQQMGMRSALNLDGGSSTSLALGGQLIDRSPVTAARVNHGLGVFVRP